MNKHMRSLGVISFLAVAVLIGAGIWLFLGNKQAQAPVTTLHTSSTGSVASTSSPTQTSITFDNLAQNQALKLPITITGTIPGGWFFEGSFPVFMKDANGNQIGVALARSSQNWMTSNIIPFSVTLPATNYQGQGTLVFTKDNPSGEPQFDDSYVVNVVFQ